MVVVINLAERGVRKTCIRIQKHNGIVRAEVVIGAVASIGSWPGCGPSLGRRRQHVKEDQQSNGFVIVHRIPFHDIFGGVGDAQGVLDGLRVRRPELLFVQVSDPQKEGTVGPVRIRGLIEKGLEQPIVFNQVIEAVHHSQEGRFFLSGDGDEGGSL